MKLSQFALSAAGMLLTGPSVNAQSSTSTTRNTSTNDRGGVFKVAPQNAPHLAGAFSNTGPGFLNGNDWTGSGISGNYPQKILVGVG